MIMATNHLPLSLSIVEENEKQASFSVFKSELLVPSEKVVKMKDHLLFQPLNMKRAPKDIIFKSKDIFKPLNLDQQKTLFKPVAMVRPLPLAVVKPIKKEESFIKPFSEESHSWHHFQDFSFFMSQDDAHYHNHRNAPMTGTG